MKSGKPAELVRVIAAAGKVTCDLAGEHKQFELKEFALDYASKAIMACLSGIGMYSVTYLIGMD